MTEREQTARRLVALLDLTSLNDDDTEASILALCARARTPLGPVAAVCVYPRFVALARRALDLAAATGIKVATVCNFPNGDADLDTVSRQVSAALAAGADEIDVVYPYRALLAGDRTAGRSLVARCHGLCHGRAVLKVILETGELADPALIRQASLDAIDAGAQFIKTSTGKVRVNATPEACAVMLQAIVERGGNVGLKAAGGIRTFAEAEGYLHQVQALLGRDQVTAAHLRLGASSLLDALLAECGQGQVTAAGGY